MLRGYSDRVIQQKVVLNKTLFLTVAKLQISTLIS